LALVYTSGTTGHPKGVVQTHANILANIDHLNYWMPYGEGGVYLHAAPIFHILDLPFMFAAPAMGACQVTIPKFSPQSFCEMVDRERVTHTVLVPTMINLLTQFADLKKYDLTSLRHLAYGGSPMAPELIHRTREVLPDLKLVQGYGLSETGFLTGLHDHEHTENRLASCGRTCPGIEVLVVDESGKEVEAGSSGELVARGANVMRGYWNNSQETGRAFRDGMFRTGDVGYRDSDGYFYILDRSKDMIVTGGENVYSGEVEAVIYEHPAILEVLSTEAAIENVIGKPSSKVLAKVLNSLDDICRAFIARSPFVIVRPPILSGISMCPQRETRPASCTCWTTAPSLSLNDRETGVPTPFGMCCRTPKWG